MSRKWCMALGTLVLVLSWVVYSLPQAPQPDCSIPPAVTQVSGQDVLVTENPEETLFWKLELLKHAQQTIEFAAGFAGGPLLEQALLVLDEQLAAKPSLHVHLCIADCPLYGWSEQAKIDVLSRRYPQRFHFLLTGITPMREGYQLAIGENHIKLLVVDGAYCVVGGSNLYHCQNRSVAPENERYQGIVHWIHPKAGSDMDFVIKGPVAETLRHHFFQLWGIYADAPTHVEELSQQPIPLTIAAFESHPRLVRDVPMKAIISGPRLNAGACSAEYIALFNRAERSVDMMHMYLSPVEEVYNSLIAASARGVSISLITNGAYSSLPIVTRTIGSYNRAHLLPLVTGCRYGMTQRTQAETSLSGNCSIYACNAPEVLYHKKVMVVDDHICVIGSYNLGYKSHYLDYEILVEADSSCLAKQIQQIIDRDRQSATLCQRSELMDWYFGWGSRTLALIEGALFVGPLY